MQSAWDSVNIGYDDFGNKVWEKNEVGNRTDYTYDDYNRLSSTSVAAPEPPPGATPYPAPTPSATTTFDYTGSNGTSAYSHTTKSIRKTTSPAGIVTGQTFDNNFRLASTIQAEQEPAVRATTIYDYDGNGNQTSLIDPRNKPSTTIYDDRNRKKTVTNALNQITKWDYDNVGNVLILTRSDNTTEEKSYDAMNRV
ncbi:MAG: hypothetical protein H0T11_02335, partial [Chthoniobacterales bacterium]|nr:hypothetical protein [Chthoniobacterales bacterium]